LSLDCAVANDLPHSGHVGYFVAPQQQASVRGQQIINKPNATKRRISPKHSKHAFEGMLSNAIFTLHVAS
jgi:hypothetical protein